MFHQARLTESAAIAVVDPIRPNGSAQPAPFDLAKIASVVRNQMGLIVKTTLLCLIAGGLYAVLATPRYTAATQILIDPSDLRVLENGLTSNNQMSDGAMAQVESQVRVLNSDNVLLRVVASERLDNDPEFNPALRPQGLIAGLLASQHFIPQSWLVAITGGNEQQASPDGNRDMTKIIDAFEEKLKVTNDGRSRIITIAFQSTNPATAAIQVPARDAMWIPSRVLCSRSSRSISAASPK